MEQGMTPVPMTEVRAMRHGLRGEEQKTKGGGRPSRSYGCRVTDQLLRYTDSQAWRHVHAGVASRGLSHAFKEMRHPEKSKRTRPARGHPARGHQARGHHAIRAIL